MDMDVVAGMLFVIIILVMIMGFVLVLPITRRLGELLEQRLNEKSLKGDAGASIRHLEEAVQAMRADLDRLVERQAFTESLLGERIPAPRLPPPEGPS